MTEVEKVKEYFRGLLVEFCKSSDGVAMSVLFANLTGGEATKTVVSLEIEPLGNTVLKGELRGPLGNASIRVELIGRDDEAGPEDTIH